MARPKKIDTSGSTDDLAVSLMQALNARSTSSHAILQGDMAINCWGPTIPHIAFQWLIGGSTVLPSQRYFTFSGLPKSFKSTLNIEVGNWFIAAGGLHIQIDTENKTSPTMLTALTFKNANPLVSDGRRRTFKPVSTIDEWQNQLTEVVKFSRKVSNRPKGERIPIFVSIDSLSAATTEDRIDTLMVEGNAKSRDFPVDALKTSNYLKALRLHNSTMNVGVVQHLMQDIGADAGYGGPKFREKGAMAMKFGTSVNIRMTKLGQVEAADHDSAPTQGPPVEGYTLKLQTECSCVGPDKNVLEVDILWQYIDDEQGFRKQAMWYDWDGALGKMLWQRKYDEKKSVYAYEQAKMDAAIKFVQVKAKRIKCEELGLENASFTEFGRAIEANPDVKLRVQKYLCIQKYPDIQEADIDFSAPEAEDE